MQYFKQNGRQSKHYAMPMSLTLLHTVYSTWLYAKCSLKWKLKRRYSYVKTYRSFATTVSQLKISDFSGETFKGFEVLYFSMSAMKKHLFSSG